MFGFINFFIISSAATWKHTPKFPQVCCFFGRTRAMAIVCKGQTPVYSPAPLRILSLIMNIFSFLWCTPPPLLLEFFYHALPHEEDLSHVLRLEAKSCLPCPLFLKMMAQPNQQSKQNCTVFIKQNYWTDFKKVYQTTNSEGGTVSIKFLKVSKSLYQDAPIRNFQLLGTLASRPGS